MPVAQSDKSQGVRGTESPGLHFEFSSDLHNCVFTELLDHEATKNTKSFWTPVALRDLRGFVVKFLFGRFCTAQTGNETGNLHRQDRLERSLHLSRRDPLCEIAVRQDQQD